MTTYTRISRAASVLDRKAPFWWRRVEPSRLDMGSNTMCVLGQAFGNFRRSSAKNIRRETGLLPFLGGRSIWVELVRARQEGRKPRYLCGIEAIDNLDLRRPPRSEPLFVPADWVGERELVPMS